jgi:AraC-like DNA-binding protein
LKKKAPPRISSSKSIVEQTDDKVTAAMKEYERKRSLDEDVSIRAVAKAAGVSPSNLSRRLAGKTKSRFGRTAVNRKLDGDLTRAVMLYCQRSDFIGSPSRKDMITNTAKRLLAKEGYTRTENVSIGKNWTTRFLKRHPEFHVRKTTSKDLSVWRPPIQRSLKATLRTWDL